MAVLMTSGVTIGVQKQHCPRWSVSTGFSSTYTYSTFLQDSRYILVLSKSLGDSSPSALRLVILMGIRVILLWLYLNTGLSSRTLSPTNLDHPVQHCQLFIKVYWHVQNNISNCIDWWRVRWKSRHWDRRAMRSFCTAPMLTVQLHTEPHSPLSLGLA